MVKPLDGPRIAPKSRVARQLIVILHGYGADGNDLIALGQQWQSLLPDAAFVAPHAPEPCAQAPSGRQWFSLTMRDPDERWRGVNAARPALDAFLDRELARHNLDASKLAIVGFSQGTMMALHVGLRRKLAPAAIVGYSGLLVGPEFLGEATARQSIPLFGVEHADQPVQPLADGQRDPHFLGEFFVLERLDERDDAAATGEKAFRDATLHGRKRLDAALEPVDAVTRD